MLVHMDPVCRWRSEDKFWESVLSLNHEIQKSVSGHKACIVSALM